MKITILVLFISLGAISCSDNKVIAPSPPMGWNSWNWHGKDEINEQIIYETIDAFIEKGLDKAGYEYIVIDGGWRSEHLGPDGELLSHPEKFPNGIRPLADYAHSKGLKLGLHTVPGTHDCGGDKVGGFGNEETHFQQFVDWGIDFIKLDKCLLETKWSEELLKETYKKWAKLIKESGNDIVLSISAYEIRDWYPEVGQMARTTYDISSIKFRGANFNKTKQGVYPIALANDRASEYAKRGFWNDPDMLVTGGQGLTYAEEQTHFALWSIMSSPLILGNDPRVSSMEELAIITNKKAIEINQKYPVQGKMILSNGDADVWLKDLGDGEIAVLIINTNDSINKVIDLPLAMLGVQDNAKLYDVYKQEYLDKSTSSYTYDLEPHGSKYLVIKGNQ